MIKLIYRGINYRSHQLDKQGKKSDLRVPVDRCGSRSPHSPRLISIRPMYYYTYRGVSYTKNLISDSHKRILLDIDRQ